MDSNHGRIVVGVDGSDASIEALRWALQQAELTSSDLEAVTTWQHPLGYAAELAAERINWAGLAQTTLDDALASVGSDTVTIRGKVTEGHPAQVLTDSSKNADLLVVGSRGHGGFVGMLVGSVSGHVTAHATCPVVVLHRSEKALDPVGA